MFVANAEVCILRCGPDNEVVFDGNGGADPDYLITIIHGIKADGGDW